jgi:hypothetical protein
MIMKKTIYISDELHKKLKLYAVNQGLSITQALDKLLPLAFSLEEQDTQPCPTNTQP